MKAFIVTILTIFAVSSCTEENETRYSVDPSLQEYVETFYAEAAERGVTLPQNLIAEFNGQIQGISKADRSMDQNYLYFKPELFNSMKAAGAEDQIEAHIYAPLIAVFMKRTVTYQADTEAMFDVAFR